MLFSKVEQSIYTAEDQKGIFTRRYHCNDIYSGIESIARTYGFSGLEPNTVVMGWARYSKSPDKFCNLINVFKQLDYNILFCRFPDMNLEEASFGTTSFTDNRKLPLAQTASLIFSMRKTRFNCDFKTTHLEG